MNKKTNIVSGNEGDVIVFGARINRFYVTGKRSPLFNFQGYKM